jgi:ABC-type antimicrobial peptide transport system permease subunit
VAAGDARPLRSVVRDAQGPARVMTSLLSVLALLAAALGAIGLYAALAGWVARRRSEIGTRLALGAQPHRLAAGVLATGLASTGIGVVIGAVGGAIAGRAIRGLLYGISPLDPLAFAAPAAVLLATGLIAAAVPAWRAAAVPPAEALRAP